MLVDSFLICFWKFYFLTPSDDFAKAKAFACCMEAIFANGENGLIFRILGVFSSGFSA